MPLSGLDASAVARYLAPLAQRADDVAEAFFEHVEVVVVPPEGEPPGIRVRRESGLAVRLRRGDSTWIASRDRIDSETLRDAVRQVARVRPPAAPVSPRVHGPRLEDGATYAELDGFCRHVSQGIRRRHSAFPLRLGVSRHRRRLRVVTPRFAPVAEAEEYYAVDASMPWGRLGALLSSLSDRSADEIASRLVSSFRAREAAPPEAVDGPVVLGPAAAAVFLHEIVGHALEADTLSLGGDPAAAIGVRLGPEGFDVLDDPRSAPDGIRRTADDEGRPTIRRWLLRDGVVEQALADDRWSERFPALEPGAARRGSRHDEPGPRSTYLVVPPRDGGDDPTAVAGTGLFFPEAARGRLDPRTGRCAIELPHGRRIDGGALADPVGACVLEGRVAELLERVAAVGSEAFFAGAGWCAKGGTRLPVWASCPSILLDGVRVAP